MSLVSWEEHLRQVAEARASLLVSLAVQEEKFFHSRHATQHQRIPFTSALLESPPLTAKQVCDKSTWTIELVSDAKRASSVAAPQPMVAQLLQGVIEDDTVKLRDELNQLLLVKAQLSTDIAKLNASHQAEMEEAASKEQAAVQHRHANLQRKATLAAFRLASVASMRRTGPQSTNEQEIKVPPLGPANCDSFFDVSREAMFVETISQLSSSNGELPENLAKIQNAAKTEQQLFDSLLDVFKSSVAHDVASVEQEKLRHELKLSLLESQLSKLLASEPIVAIIQGGINQVSDLGDFPIGVSQRNLSDDDSDYSSDSDILVPSKDVEFMKAADGSIRLCVGLQSSDPHESFDRHSVVDTCFTISKRESKLQNSMEELGNILRQLEKCNDVFESELLCLRCERNASEMFLLWPCGHHFCLDCIYAQEQSQGGYCCIDCRVVTYDTPVVATFANELSARMAFKRSGFRTLFDVLGNFRKLVQEVDGSLTQAVRSLYRDGIDSNVKQ